MDSCSGAKGIETSCLLKCQARSNKPRKGLQRLHSRDCTGRGADTDRRNGRGGYAVRDRIISGIVSATRQLKATGTVKSRCGGAYNAINGISSMWAPKMEGMDLPSGEG